MNTKSKLLYLNNILNVFGKSSKAIILTLKELQRATAQAVSGFRIQRARKTHLRLIL
jgi:hypothetical protein